MKRRDSKPLAVDLFSGAGGLSEGLHQAGIPVAASVESDLHAARTQRKNHDSAKGMRTVVITEDIRSVSVEKLASTIEQSGQRLPDIIVGGLPCQGFSRSNMKTRNSQNPLNCLYLDFLRIVAGLKPLVVVIENVADMIRFEGGEVAERIVRGLRELGYKVDKEVLNAVDYGVLQRRKRMIVVASRLGRALSFPDPVIQNGEFISVWDAISDLPSLSNGNRVNSLRYRAQEPLSDY